MRPFPITLVLVLVALVLCGCPTKPSPVTPAATKPYVGLEVEVLAPKLLNLPEIWEVQLHEWISQTGATVRWTEYRLTDESTLVTKLESPVPAGGRLILFPLNRLSELDRFLATLDGNALSEFDTKDLLRGLRDRVASRDRSLVAIPVCAPILVCYYRADLLRTAGLKAPETWEDYQSLVDSLDRWAPNLTALEPLGHNHRATMFFARSLAYVKHPENYSVWFDLDSGRATVDSAGFTQAIELARRAWKRMPPTILDLSPVDCRNEVVNGRAALAIGMEPVSNIMSSEISRPQTIEIGVCALPGSRRVFNKNSNRWDAIPPGNVHSPGLCGFDGHALGVQMPDRSGKDVAAFHLMSRLIGDQFESNWQSLPKSICRESQIGSAATWHETGLTVEESSQQVDAAAQTLRSPQLVASFPIPAAGDFNDATARWIEHVMDQSDFDASSAIKNLQDAFEQVVTKIGPEKIRADYRRGLGLPKIE